jgi:hypothetical protein
MKYKSLRHCVETTVCHELSSEDALIEIEAYLRAVLSSAKIKYADDMEGYDSKAMECINYLEAVLDLNYGR